MKVKQLFWMVVVGGAALFAYDRYESGTAGAAPLQVTPGGQGAHVAQIAQLEDRSWIKQRDAPPGAAAAPATSPAAKCDGRTSCPQMTSCAEARYFIQHCPNTAMDGDADGVPCEDQWCR